MCTAAGRRSTSREVKAPPAATAARGNGTERRLTAMISAWIDEIKREADPDGLGMILVHNGIVRGTTKRVSP